jgi:hypothetical protein
MRKKNILFYFFQVRSIVCFEGCAIVRLFGAVCAVGYAGARWWEGMALKIERFRSDRVSKQVGELW